MACSPVWKVACLTPYELTFVVKLFLGFGRVCACYRLNNLEAALDVCVFVAPFYSCLRAKDGCREMTRIIYKAVAPSKHVLGDGNSRKLECRALQANVQ